MADFNAEVYQNEFLPDGGTDVHAVVTVTCTGAGAAGQVGGVDAHHAGDRVAVRSAGTAPADPGTKPPAGTTAKDLLAQADQLFTDAETALKSGDLATYATKEAAARDLVRQALDLLNK